MIEYITEWLWRDYPDMSLLQALITIAGLCVLAALIVGVFMVFINLRDWIWK